MNAADSDSQQSRQGKSAYIYPMISQEFTQAWFISVLKRKLFEPPAPIRIPLGTVGIPSSQKLISEEG